MQLNPIDVVFTLILVILVLRAGFRGFVREFMAVAAIVLGVAAAALFAGLVSIWLDQILGPSMWNHVIAFLGLFLLVYLVIKLTEGLLNTLVERIHLDALDHALGLFFGCVEGLLVIFMLIMIMQVQPFIRLDAVLRNSLYAELLMPLAPYAGSIMSS
ncbi:CvpA family protein [Spirochaeta africana]|uniref:Putative membrane protein, required for colicin V production n=1 Tax=Spirochaeta africana (strain ATCC 700263 / DSM 8902 / Z-7692) TaxID=889378 RepID=H9UGP7_SPIAZ|nr:CvpA family protein [Spirochaeta africana]AFG36690.1 putative membrane protein, required for colicin V production [Spirochaeta africana DSM 8902]